MRKFATAAFWDYAGERVLKTVLQTGFIAGILGQPILGLDLVGVASLAVGTGLASLATAVLAYKGDGTDNPNDTSVGVPFSE
jgi:hypothetical protein